MTTDLDRLIEAVKAGGVCDWGYANGFPRRALGGQWKTGMRAYNGSLDAAVTLLEALLPEAIWGRSLDGSMWVSLSAKTVTVYGFYLGNSDSPARSLLLATLQAYRNKMESN